MAGKKGGENSKKAAGNARVSCPSIDAAPLQLPALPLSSQRARANVTLRSTESRECREKAGRRRCAESSRGGSRVVQGSQVQLQEVRDLKGCTKHIEKERRI